MMKEFGQERASEKKKGWAVRCGAQSEQREEKEGEEEEEEERKTIYKRNYRTVQ